MPDEETEKYINESIYYRLKNNVNYTDHMNAKYGEDWTNLLINYRLMQSEGFESDDNFLNMLYVVAIVILLIILITSIVVVKNSFSISIVEKTRQYGILKSLGASNDKIRRDIYFEGFTLGIIGIFFGILLGIMVNKILVMIMNIFSYGFIIVISLIALTSTFNTITSNIILRKREFATLRSVGMTDGNLKEIMKLESLFLGVKSLIFGIPIGLAISCLLYYLIKETVSFSYYLPVTSIVISILVVFIILYLIMHYAITRVDKLNIVETIKNENV